MYFQAIPISRKEANDYIEKLHRHHGKTVDDKYRLGAVVGNKIVGIVQVGRPVSRYLDDGKTVEILRLCTDGTPNACLYLHSRAVKIAYLLGYEKVITYTLLSDNGASLKASGFTLDGVTRGGSRSCKSRPRTDKAPTCEGCSVCPELIYCKAHRHDTIRLDCGEILLESWKKKVGIE